MNTIPQDEYDVNDYYIDGAGIVRRHSAKRPIATPLANALAASYASGDTDAAGADAAVMTLEEWLANEPEISYWEEDEVMA